MNAMENILENLKAESMQNSCEGETYEKDGILYCANCDTPRQTTITNPFTGKETVVGCVCKCQHEANEKEREEIISREKQRQITKLQRNSLLGDRYKDVTFQNTETGVNNSFDVAFARCQKYCDISKAALENGYGIYIYGDKGTGKTRLTACMANELIGQFRPIMFTNFFEISEMIRQTFSKQGESESRVINQIATIDFLFLDDLGTEKVSQNGEDNWLQGKIFEILNKRYNNRRPTIFTSNYTLQELMTERGLMDKTVDRILEMSTVILKIEGQSYRMKTRRNDVPF